MYLYINYYTRCDEERIEEGIEEEIEEGIEERIEEGIKVERGREKGGELLVGFGVKLG